MLVYQRYIPFEMTRISKSWMGRYQPMLWGAGSVTRGVSFCQKLRKAEADGWKRGSNPQNMGFQSKIGYPKMSWFIEVWLKMNYLMSLNEFDGDSPRPRIFSKICLITSLPYVAPESAQLGPFPHAQKAPWQSSEGLGLESERMSLSRLGVHILTRDSPQMLWV